MPWRDDYISRPPVARQSVPAIEYPTPNVDDVLITEDVPLTNGSYLPLEYGTTREGDPNARLVWQGPVVASNNEIMHRRIWATDRANQDDYNYEITYPDGDTAYPLIQRTYIIRRSQYAAIAEGTADPSFAGCVLTRQRLVRLEDQQLDSLYVMVQRWYEKVPGKALIDSSQEDVENRVIIYTYRRRVSDSSTDLPVPGTLTSSALGASFANGKRWAWGATSWSTAAAYVIDAQKRPVEDSDDYVDLIVQYCCLPPTRYEYPSVGFTFPGVYRVLSNLWYRDDSGPKPQPPWVGVHYTLQYPRSLSRPAKVTYDFFLEGSPPTMPDLFRVESPAAGSKFLDIPANTIHDPVTINSTEWGTVVETYPASTPPTYHPTDVLKIQCEDTTWRGKIKMRKTVEISESRSPYTFP